MTINGTFRVLIQPLTLNERMLSATPTKSYKTTNKRKKINTD